MKISELKISRKLTLNKDTVFKDFDDKTKVLKAGNYYIVGFWINLVGLTQEIKPKGEYYGHSADFYILIGELTKFKGVTQ
jgi:hypothetical protein